MATFTILFAFALMLFLPCAVAMLGSRDSEDSLASSAYSDRIVNPLLRDRSVNQTGELPTSNPVNQMAGQMPSPPATPLDFKGIKLDVSDPVLANRKHKPHQARLQRNEIETLLAIAAATRAHADDLAAIAQRAADVADAADAEAFAAEQAAASAIRDLRRAA